MNFKDILKVAAVGALVYGAYKLGEKRGEKKYPYPKTKRNLDYEEYEEVEEEEEDEFVDDVELEDEEISEETKNEIDYVQEIIDNLKSKRNKTKGDKNTIELLEIKLQQLLKGK